MKYKSKCLKHLNQTINTYGLRVTDHRDCKAFKVERIIPKLLPWEKPNVTREAVAKALKEIFRESLITIGGHHVAVHNPITGDRMFMIEGNTPDFN